MFVWICQDTVSAMDTIHTKKRDGSNFLLTKKIYYIELDLNYNISSILHIRNEKYIV